mgnify:CR=1 FL=1
MARRGTIRAMPATCRSLRSLAAAVLAAVVLASCRVESNIALKVNPNGTGSVSVTVTGTNDIATLTGDSKAITESDVVQSVTGQLTLADLDAVDATVEAQTTSGTLGSFSVGTDGAWTYTMGSAADQLVGLTVIGQRRAGDGADENFEEARVDARIRSGGAAVEATGVRAAGGEQVGGGLGLGVGELELVVELAADGEAQGDDRGERDLLNITVLDAAVNSLRNAAIASRTSGTDFVLGT